ncbi:hypothetical protein TGAM01_v203383 [Trichoderma gamsii]|uniref:Tricarboxylate transport protein n=1 Tax=Trichoderma gamsii TaxID=398673 RepID=A0A2P4ZTI8_9HYPO|nr:hypothetical protein TGAM01_v203383 [Trichoderma gamsii]PON27616.1 hypothetical protein TGAM01_v203383 [Trichoderma gamsii]
MSRLQDSSIAISVTSRPLNHHRQRNQNISPGVSLLAGATAGAVEAAITYPFEFAKTRLQLKHNAYHATTITTKSPFYSLLQTVRQNGIRVVYTGCSTLVIGTACKAGVRFLTFDSIKKIISDGDGKLSPARGLLAGMAAGAVESVIAITPTERIKTALYEGFSLILPSSVRPLTKL